MEKEKANREGLHKREKKKLKILKNHLTGVDIFGKIEVWILLERELPDFEVPIWGKSILWNPPLTTVGSCNRTAAIADKPDKDRRKRNGKPKMQRRTCGAAFYSEKELGQVYLESTRVFALAKVKIRKI